MACTAFRFRRILRLKTQLRKAVQDEVGMLRRELAGVERDIIAAERARERNRAAAAAAALRASRAADLRLYDVYDRGQQVIVGILQARAADIKARIEERRQVLLARRREERQFEMLEKRQLEREAEAARHDEANLQDDLARQAARRTGTMGRMATRTLASPGPPGGREEMAT